MHLVEICIFITMQFGLRQSSEILLWSGRIREGLPTRAYGMVKLDPEIKILESFGKRAYTNELNAQRTIINDLLAGKSLSSASTFSSPRLASATCKHERHADI